MKCKQKLTIEFRERSLKSSIRTQNLVDNEVKSFHDFTFIAIHFIKIEFRGFNEDIKIYIFFHVLMKVAAS